MRQVGYYQEFLMTYSSATHRKSIVAFPFQQWFRERATILRSTYIVCLIVCFLLGNSPASEFYMPTFRNTLFHLHRRVGMKILHTYPPMKMEQAERSET